MKPGLNGPGYRINSARKIAAGKIRDVACMGTRRTRYCLRGTLTRPTGGKHGLETDFFLVPVLGAGSCMPAPQGPTTLQCNDDAAQEVRTQVEETVAAFASMNVVSFEIDVEKG